MEEAQEVCDAAGENDPAHLTYEICDLFFYALVRAGYADISLDRRESHGEKKGRPGCNGPFGGDRRRRRI